MKPDVILSWPATCDYPLWRQFLADNRHRFAKVIVALTTNTLGPVDYRQFVQGALGKDVDCFDAPQTGEWRDTAVNAALDRSTAPWVWFTEQDFAIVNPARFWRAVELAPTAVIGFRDGLPRWHPASLFVRRDVIERTTRDFGPMPVDHFYQFGWELDHMTGGEELPEGSFSHMQGLSQNHYLIDTGQSEGIFKKDEFRDYLRECLQVSVPLDPRWTQRAEREVGLVTA